VLGEVPAGADVHELIAGAVHNERWGGDSGRIARTSVSKNISNIFRAIAGLAPYRSIRSLHRFKTGLVGQAGAVISAKMPCPRTEAPTARRFDEVFLPQGPWVIIGPGRTGHPSVQDERSDPFRVRSCEQDRERSTF